MTAFMNGCLPREHELLRAFRQAVATARARGASEAQIAELLAQAEAHARAQLSPLDFRIVRARLQAVARG